MSIEIHLTYSLPSQIKNHKYRGVILLLVLQSIGLILQTPQPTYEWMPYSIGVLALTQLFQIVMALIKKYGNSAEARAQAAAKNLETLYAREERLSKERSEKYREDNKLRDQRLLDVLQKIDADGSKFIDALKETNERFACITTEDRKNFVDLINKVMEQNAYATGVLVELKKDIELLPEEFQNLKKEINIKLDNMSIHYELHLKEHNEDKP